MSREITLQPGDKITTDTIPDLTSVSVAIDGDFIILGEGEEAKKILVSDFVAPIVALAQMSYGGLATTASAPGSANTWYFAGPGTFANFPDENGQPVVLTENMNIISWDGTKASVQAVPVNMNTTNKNYTILKNFLSGVSPIANRSVSGDGTVNTNAPGWYSLSYSVEGLEGKTVIFNAKGFNPNASMHMSVKDVNGVQLIRYTINENYTLPFAAFLPLGSVHIDQQAAVPGDPVPTELELTCEGVTETKAFVKNVGADPITSSYIENNAQNRETIAALANGAVKMSYAELQTKIAAGTLPEKRQILVEAFGTGGYSFLTVAKSATEVDKNVTVIGQDFDFYALDLASGVIKAYDNIACIARYNSATSKWEFVSNNGETDLSAHKLKGFASLEMPNSQTLRANYLRTDYTYVISLVSSPDETYTINGIMIGPSVGLLYSDFKFSCSGLFGQIAESGGDLVIDPSYGFQNPLKTVVFNATTGVITITHSGVSYSGVTITSMNAAHRPVLQPSGSSAIAFQMIDNAGNVVTDITGMKFQVHRTGVRTLLNSEMGVAGSNIWIQGLMMKELN